MIASMGKPKTNVSKAAATLTSKAAEGSKEAESTARSTSPRKPPTPASR